MLEKIKEATAYIKNIIVETPVAGVVLGSGRSRRGIGKWLRQFWPTNKSRERNSLWRYSTFSGEYGRRA